MTCAATWYRRKPSHEFVIITAASLVRVKIKREFGFESEEGNVGFLWLIITVIFQGKVGDGQESKAA